MFWLPPCLSLGELVVEQFLIWLFSEIELNYHILLTFNTPSHMWTDHKAQHVHNNSTNRGINIDCTQGLPVGDHIKWI